MDVEEIALPGIGLRYDFATRSGRRVGVVSHRNGRRDLVIYDRDDPDSSREVLQLTDDEGDVLAELLGAPRIVERLADMHREVEGLLSEKIPIDPGSPYDGRTLGDTKARTRTAASIVAVVRGPQVHASPRPDFRFEAGDMLVVVGTREGADAVAELLAHG
jgi:K+:H+ antiporter subunit KhtT